MKLSSCSFFFAVLLCGLISIPTLSQPTSQPEKEIQSWNEFHLIAPLNKKTDLIFMGVLRAGSNSASSLRPIDERGGAGIAFKLNKHLTVMPTYLYVAQQPTPTRKNFEHRLVLNLTGKFSLGKFTFTDRNLIERRVRHALDDFVMYRNRLQIDHPVKLGSLNFRVYVADEVWYSTLVDAWVRNRISAGVFKQFTPRFYAETFYLRQNDGRARPGDVHAIGTLFKITL
ncbi:MAG: DUF2490 domain-containing protein [Acidobacteria bacterium]|nr:DUF2490 domain-containing protein [Acidobacteriota bacterium]